MLPSAAKVSSLRAVVSLLRQNQGRSLLSALLAGPVLRYTRDVDIPPVSRQRSFLVFKQFPDHKSKAFRYSHLNMSSLLTDVAWIGSSKAAIPTRSSIVTALSAQPTFPPVRARVRRMRVASMAVRAGSRRALLCHMSFTATTETSHGF